MNLMQFPFYFQVSLPIYFFHLNISSLSFHFDELTALLAENKINLDFLGFSETRVRLNRNSLNSISMPSYNIKHTPTESSKQGINLKKCTHL